MIFVGIMKGNWSKLLRAKFIWEVSALLNLPVQCHDGSSRAVPNNWCVRSGRWCVYVMCLTKIRLKWVTIESSLFFRSCVFFVWSAVTCFARSTFLVWEWSTTTVSLCASRFVCLCALSAPAIGSCRHSFVWISAFSSAYCRDNERVGVVIVFDSVDIVAYVLRTVRVKFQKYRHRQGIQDPSSPRCCNCNCANPLYPTYVSSLFSPPASCCWLLLCYCCCCCCYRIYY